MFSIALLAASRIIENCWLSDLKPCCVCSSWSGMK